MGGSWSLLTIHHSFDHGGRESHRDRPVRLVRMSARAPPFSLNGGLCLRYGLGRRRHSYSHASCRHLLVRILLSTYLRTEQESHETVHSKQPWNRGSHTSKKGTTCQVRFCLNSGCPKRESGVVLTEPCSVVLAENAHPFDDQPPFRLLHVPAKGKIENHTEQ